MEYFTQNDGGQAQWVRSDLSIVISRDVAGNYGYSAEVSSKGQKTVNRDVKLETVKVENATQAKEMAAVLAPEVKWSSVAFVRVGNVGVKANGQDAAGMMLFELMSQDMKSLATLATIGWGFGRCAK